MTDIAYVDSSLLICIAFREPGWREMEHRLNRYLTLISSNLLEAEVNAAHVRSGVVLDTGLFDGIDWVLPDRPLSQEIELAAAAGYLRGADLWHLATALRVSADPGDIDFLTLNRRQAEAAGALGFGL